MNICRDFLLLLIVLSLSLSAWGISFDDSRQKDVQRTEPSELRDLSRDGKLNPSSLKNKPKIGTDGIEFDLFETEVEDKKKSSSGIHESLSSMLSPELKQEAKKIWMDSSEIRDAINSFTMEADSEDLVLPKASDEMTDLEGYTSDEILNKNLSPEAYDNKEPDEIMVKELFDDFYDLLRNAFIIIVTTLIVGKIISIIVKKIKIGNGRRKKRHSRRRSKKRRKKRRHSLAR